MILPNAKNKFRFFIVIPRDMMEGVVFHVLKIFLLARIKKGKGGSCASNLRGGEKKVWHNLLYGGRGLKRGCPKQNLDMRRGGSRKNLLETDCFVPCFDYQYGCYHTCFVIRNRAVQDSIPDRLVL
jgi:hypothetical protein